MAKQYNTNMLQAGDTFIVRGRTSYAHLTHVIDGAELEEAIKKATQKGRMPETKPHTSVTLVDAFIEYANPAQPTLAELYAAERLYKNKDGKTCYSVIRKSPTLADYGYIADPAHPEVVTGTYLDPEKQIDSGLDVRCFFRIYDGKPGMNKGVSLDSIVFIDPISYYTFNNTAAQLEARGLTWTPPVGEAPVYNPATSQAPIQQAPVAPQPITQVPAYQAPQAPAPVQQQQMAPQPAPAYQAPVAPAPQATPVDPYAGNAPQVAGYGAPAPAYQAPQAPAPVQQQQMAPQPAPAPQAQPMQQAPAQTIGNTGGSAFDGAYQY